MVLEMIIEEYLSNSFFDSRVVEEHLSNSFFDLRVFYIVWKPIFEI